jgi:hypothetical protein
VTTATPERVLDHIEAEARRTMAEHAAIEPRGWDSKRRRAELHEAVDVLLDQWAGLRG